MLQNGGFYESVNATSVFPSVHDAVVASLEEKNSHNTVRQL